MRLLAIFPWFSIASAIALTFYLLKTAPAAAAAAEPSHVAQPPAKESEKETGSTTEAKEGEKETVSTNEKVETV